MALPSTAASAAAAPLRQWHSHHSSCAVESSFPHSCAAAADASDGAAAATDPGSAGHVQCQAAAAAPAAVYGGGGSPPAFQPGKRSLGQDDRTPGGAGLAGTSPPPGALPATPATSPSPAAALLAATLVRARAAHFERFSGGTQLPGLGGGGGGGGGAPVPGQAAAAALAGGSAMGGGAMFAMDLDLDLDLDAELDEAPPTPRHCSARSGGSRVGARGAAAAALAPLPLHPLAPHPLALAAAAAGGGGGGAGAGAAAAGAGGVPACLSHSLSRCGSGGSLQGSLYGSGGSWKEEELAALAATLGGNAGYDAGSGGGSGFLAGAGPGGQPSFDCPSRYSDDPVTDYSTDGEEESIFDRPSWAFGVLGAAKPPAVAAAPGAGAAGATARGWGGLVSRLPRGRCKAGGEGGAAAGGTAAATASAGAHTSCRPKRRWCFGFMFRRPRPTKHNPALSGPPPGGMAAAAAAAPTGAGAGAAPGRSWYVGGRPGGIALSRTSSGSALCAADSGAAAGSEAGPAGGSGAAEDVAGTQPGSSNPAFGVEAAAAAAADAAAAAAAGVGTGPPHAFPRYGNGFVRALTQRFGRAGSGSCTIGGVQYTPGAGRARSFSGLASALAAAGGGSYSGGGYGPAAAGGTAAGAALDALFDDLVGHVGQLLGSHPHVAAHMGAVEGLSDRLLQLHGLCEALERKEDEVEHLRGVLRELSVTRGEAMRLKVHLAESLQGLQEEYSRVLRAATLAQATCRQHAARAGVTRRQLADTAADLVRHQAALAAARQRNRALATENAALAAQVAALEASRPDPRRGGSYMALVAAASPVMY
ncbi:hypothetical protein HXX76_004024 [Chlamydomonas incerta]|uniref:Uncharacterized protein n=1 Tax=Chlamydomonas incerta TaxID=51695 RepID=A0A835T941_CHLIN|nr:hypothetical protein HXX76_004024 [Chlamydomonas incerta]|eukprot:KAG2441172.1 hypothetical protein HXX76_004024 [Chlamydomonas incerta]